MGLFHGMDESGPRWERWGKWGRQSASPRREESLAAGPWGRHERPISAGVQVREKGS